MQTRTNKNHSRNSLQVPHPEKKNLSWHRPICRCILLIHLGRLSCNDRGPLCTLFPDRPRSTIMALRCCLMLFCVTEPLQTIPARSTSNAWHWSTVHWSCGVIMQRCFCPVRKATNDQPLTVLQQFVVSVDHDDRSSRG